MSFNDSLEIQTNDFSPNQLAVLNDRLRRIQASLEQQSTQTAQTLLTLHVTGTLTAGNNVAPLQTLPADAQISTITVLFKTAPTATMSFRLNINGVVWQGVLQASSAFKQINLTTPAKLPGNQPITLDIINPGSPQAAADMTVQLQGSFS